MEIPKTPTVARPLPTHEQAEAYFGRIRTGPDGFPLSQWETMNIVTVHLPFPMRLAHNPAQSVRKIRVHRLCRGAIAKALETIYDHYERDIRKIQEVGADLFGGAYIPGHQRDGKLTAHAFGAGITIDPGANPEGRKYKACAIPDVVAQAFKDTGAQWGGDNINAPKCAEFSYIQNG